MTTETTTQVKERPILFSGAMVRAILDGQKTQTRRTKGLERFNQNPDGWQLDRVIKQEVKTATGYFLDLIKKDIASFWPAVCPYGKLGDRLWVRETFAQNPDFPISKGSAFVCYKADPGHEHDGLRWKPAIHMHRWASRILLEITDIRVERLQRISEADAEAEGVHRRSWEYDNGECPETTEESFSCLWDSINAKRGHGWDTNPWVWVIEFKRIEE